MPDIVNSELKTLRIFFTCNFTFEKIIILIFTSKSRYWSGWKWNILTFKKEKISFSDVICHPQLTQVYPLLSLDAWSWTPHSFDHAALAMWIFIFGEWCSWNDCFGLYHQIFRYLSILHIILHIYELLHGLFFYFFFLYKTHSLCWSLYNWCMSERFNMDKIWWFTVMRKGIFF